MTHWALHKRGAVRCVIAAATLARLTGLHVYDHLMSAPHAWSVVVAVAQVHSPAVPSSVITLLVHGTPVAHLLLLLHGCNGERKVL